MKKISTFVALLVVMSVSSAWAGETVDYKPGLIKKALESGRTVFVDYSASWCTTCARQERVVKSLRKEYPAYDRQMLFVRVDWDQFSDHSVSTSRNIPRRSTLIVLRGSKELGRFVAGTSTSKIKALLDRGVSAGS